jgi:hypothetical protein
MLLERWKRVQETLAECRFSFVDRDAATCTRDILFRSLELGKLDQPIIDAWPLNRWTRFSVPLFAPAYRSHFSVPLFGPALRSRFTVPLYVTYGDAPFLRQSQNCYRKPRMKARCRLLYMILFNYYLSCRRGRETDKPN